MSFGSTLKIGGLRLNVPALAFSLTVGVTGFLVIFGLQQQKESLQTDVSTQFSRDTLARVSELDDRLRKVKEELTELKTQQQASTSGYDFGLRSAEIDHEHEREQLDQLGRAQSALNVRLTALESALMNTPEKALAVPLLRQDIADLRRQSQTEADELRAEIARVYTNFEWGVGVASTILVGIFGVAFPLWYAKRNRGLASANVQTNA